MMRIEEAITQEGKIIEQWSLSYRNMHELFYEIDFQPGDPVRIGGEIYYVGCDYYIVLLNRLMMEDEIVLVPKKYIELVAGG